MSSGFRVLLLTGRHDVPVFHPDPQPHCAAAVELGNAMINKLREAGVQRARYTIIAPDVAGREARHG